jgi:hypothetical protein
MHCRFTQPSLVLRHLLLPTNHEIKCWNGIHFTNRELLPKRTNQGQQTSYSSQFWKHLCFRYLMNRSNIPSKETEKKTHSHKKGIKVCRPALRPTQPPFPRGKGHDTHRSPPSTAKDKNE